VHEVQAILNGERLHFWNVKPLILGDSGQHGDDSREAVNPDHFNEVRDVVHVGHD